MTFYLTPLIKYTRPRRWIINHLPSTDRDRRVRSGINPNSNTIIETFIAGVDAKSEVRNLFLELQDIVRDNPRVRPGDEFIIQESTVGNYKNNNQLTNTFMVPETRYTLTKDLTLERI